MSELVKVEPGPRVIEGEICDGSYEFRYPIREVKMMPDWEKQGRGFQLHPVQCFHRRRCYYYHQWTCGDCGTKL